MYDFEFCSRTAKGGFANEKAVCENLTTGRMMKMPNFGLKSWVMIQIKLTM